MTPAGSRGYRSTSNNSNNDEESSTFPESEPFLRDVELAEFSHATGESGDGDDDGVTGRSFPHDPSIVTNGNVEGEGSLSSSPIHFGSARSWSWSRSLRRVCGDRFEKRIGFSGKKVKSRNASRRTNTLSKRILRFFATLIMILGTIQLLGLVLGLFAAFFPDEVNTALGRWRSQEDGSDPDLSSTTDIVPVKCHSHNDYWRTVPLKSAVTAGCTGVEADVWLYGDELYVGHSESSLKPERTLTSLYVNPLLEMLTKQNPITTFHTSLDTPRGGVFDTDPAQTLILLIDFKTNGDSLWSVVSSHLESLRTNRYLTYFDGTSLVQGAITVVVTGNAPFERVVANTTYRDMFFDAPLNKMASLASNHPPTTRPSIYDSTEELTYLALVASLAGSDDRTDSDQGQGLSGVMPSSPTIYSPFNSYYASTSIQESVGVSLPYLTAKQRSSIKDQITGAHSLGLQVRYWEIPAWPISWRNYLWRELVSMGIDYLNVDDLKAATKGSWRSQGGFGRLIWGDGKW